MFQGPQVILAFLLALPWTLWNSLKGSVFRDMMMKKWNLNLLLGVVVVFSHVSDFPGLFDSPISQFAQDFEHALPQAAHD